MPRGRARWSAESRRGVALPRVTGWVKSRKEASRILPCFRHSDPLVDLLVSDGHIAFTHDTNYTDRYFEYPSGNIELVIIHRGIEYSIRIFVSI